MEHQKMLNLLNGANNSKFVTRKGSILNDNSNAKYGVGNKINYNAEVLKSNICYYNDAYILLRGDVTARTALATQITFKNCAKFTKCITIINETPQYMMLKS